MIVITYKCTSCRAKNKTTSPPEDCVLHCWRCGFDTVQTCEEVRAMTDKAAARATSRSTRGANK